MGSGGDGIRIVPGAVRLHGSSASRSDPMTTTADLEQSKGKRGPSRRANASPSGFPGNGPPGQYFKPSWLIALMFLLFALYRVGEYTLFQVKQQQQTMARLEGAEGATDVARTANVKVEQNVTELKTKESLELSGPPNSLKDSSKDLKKLWYQCNDLCRKGFNVDDNEAARAANPQLQGCLQGCSDSSRLLWNLYIEISRKSSQEGQDIKDPMTAVRFLSIKPKGLMEQRNSRLVSFQDLIELARDSHRILVEPVDFSKEYSFSSVHSYGANTISPEMFQAIQEKFPFAADEKKSLGSHNCAVSEKLGSDACIPCAPSDVRKPVHTMAEFQALDKDFTNYLYGTHQLIELIIYKRCGSRDDAIFKPAREIFLDFKEVWHAEAEKFLESKGISKLSKNTLDVFSKDSLPASLDKPGQFSKMAYIATQLRTEKWNGLLKEDCIDPLLAEFDQEFQRARQLGIQHLYLATDAMPGGILISKTYASQENDKRALYEGLVAKLIARAEAAGLTVISQPYATGQAAPTDGDVSSDSKSGSSQGYDYDTAAILDQLLCSRAPIFIATCTGSVFKDSATGTNECKAPRKVCGNYADWIKRYRVNFGAEWVDHQSTPHSFLPAIVQI